MYGNQWRSWGAADGREIDQLTNVLQQLKNDPDSRRIIVSAWNVGELDKMALAPCHAFFQFYVANGKLSCQLYQRSCDIFLGLPFNIASYALLVHMVAQQCDLEVGDFVWTGGDTHLYSNHLEQTHLQLTREPRPLPKLVIKRKPASLFDYRFEDFEIEGYDPHPPSKRRSLSELSRSGSLRSCPSFYSLPSGLSHRKTGKTVFKQRIAVGARQSLLYSLRRPANLFTRAPANTLSLCCNAKFLLENAARFAGLPLD